MNLADARGRRSGSSGGILGNISVGARVLVGFGLVLLMLFVSAGVSAVLIRGIGTDTNAYQHALDRRTQATDIDLVMQKVRVRVNQWLRSMNPDFAKQADDLLAQNVANIATGKAQVATDKERTIVADIDRALTAYIASWQVIQGLYADEAKLYADRIEAPSAVIRGDLATLRDSLAAHNAVDASRLVAEARDGFMTAETFAARYRARTNKDDATRLDTAIGAALADMDKAGHAATVPADAEMLKRSTAAIKTWHDAFTEATGLAATRAARLDSWTRNEGEAMAVGATALRAEAHAAALAAESQLGAKLSYSAYMLYVSTAVILLIGIVLSLLLARSITGPLGRITATLKALATGDRSLQVPETDRRDEIGEMAKAAQVFKDNLIEADRLRAEQEELKRRGDAEKKDAMYRMADEFEVSVKNIVGSVSSASTELQGTARSMSATAEETSRQATTVAAASEQASTNVETVASAADELSASIGEISRQVSESANIAAAAVADAERTNTKVQALAESAQRIGDVVKLINAIASQTNLLALNATIEAARAGEAGRGFAVVASEVKSLASQTAKATDDISAQIKEIQGATADSVDAIRGITGTIGRINEIAGSIASAVEEQGAATKEIARNVQQASRGTNDVSSNITGVMQAANETGAAATQVLGAAGELARNAETLRGQVDSFIAKVRTA